MTAPRAPASLSAHLIPTDIRLGRFTLRASGQPDSEGRFRWALHGPGSMGVVRRFTHTYTTAIVAIATEAADRSGLDLDVNKALPDGHPGHAIRTAIRTAGAAGLRTGLDEASRLRAELTAIVTSSGVRIEGAEDLEPVEAVRRVIAELRRPEPATLDQVERAIENLDARRQALWDRRAHLAAVSRARARLALAEEAARAAAAELEAARAEAASLA